MPIERLTPDSAIDAFVAEHVERLQNAVVYNLCAVGEQVLNAGRTTKSYTDQTGNLRSSIGYVVAVDGNIVQISDFAPSDKGTDKATGQREGKAYAMSLIKQFPQGIVLLVVAGMNYAAYVSAKGYDVLESSELLAQKLVPEMLKTLGLI